MTLGIISALGRTIPSGFGPFSNPQMVQTDASINPGNSGGPLLDRMGRVIGINTQIISLGGGNVGVGFAVPVNTAKRVVPAIISDGEYRYAYLGISGTTLSPGLAAAMDLPESTRGALVIVVVEDGPAARAGIRGGSRTVRLEGGDIPVDGDIVTAIDGVPMRSMDDLIAHMVENNRPGDKVALILLRDGAQLNIEVTLEARPR